MLVKLWHTVKVRVHLSDMTRVWLRASEYFESLSSGAVTRYTQAAGVLWSSVICFYVSTIIQQMNGTNGSEVNSHKYGKAQQYSQNISQEKPKQYADRHWPHKEVCVFYYKISLGGSLSVSFGPTKTRSEEKMKQTWCSWKSRNQL